MKQKHIFGPVPSRRLGLSLGVDLLSFKTCTLDCAYCECGATTNKTTQRKEYVSTADIKAELAEILEQSPKLDYITFAGSGEPCLASNLGEVISYVKENWPTYKIAILTNATLIYDKTIQKEIALADLIVPSIDAVSQDVFEKINLPDTKLEIEKIISGLIEFSKKFEGDIWAEVFVVPGINDTNIELSKIKDVLQKINPKKVQLNSLDRPGTQSWVTKASEEALIAIANYLQPLIVEVASTIIRARNLSPLNTNREDMILNTIKRRPCTMADLEKVCNLKAIEINKYIRRLVHKKIIYSKIEERGEFLVFDNNAGNIEIAS
jgi:wyosine [tRNA(Phe)-imidazoG37] synthetase (radical SAM superfamily)